MKVYNKLQHKKLLIGGGLSVLNLRKNKRGRWVTGMREDIPFGIFGVDKNKLKENILSICRLTNRKKIDGFPNKKIDKDVKLVILEILQGVIPSNIDHLKTGDQNYIHHLIKRSRVSGLELPRTEFTDRELNNKLSVNLGQLRSGNDSEELIKETKQILNVLSKKGYYNEFQVEHISKEFKL